VAANAARMATIDNGQLGCQWPIVVLGASFNLNFGRRTVAQVCANSRPVGNNDDSAAGWLAAGQLARRCHCLCRSHCRRARPLAAPGTGRPRR